VSTRSEAVIVFFYSPTACTAALQQSKAFVLNKPWPARRIAATLVTGALQAGARGKYYGVGAHQLNLKRDIAIKVI